MAGCSGLGGSGWTPAAWTSGRTPPNAMPIGLAWLQPVEAPAPMIPNRSGTSHRAQPTPAASRRITQQHRRARQQQATGQPIDRQAGQPETRPADPLLCLDQPPIPFDQPGSHGNRRRSGPVGSRGPVIDPIRADPPMPGCPNQRYAVPMPESGSRQPTAAGGVYRPTPGATARRAAIALRPAHAPESVGSACTNPTVVGSAVACWPLVRAIGPNRPTRRHASVV